MCWRNLAIIILLSSILLCGFVPTGHSAWAQSMTVAPRSDPNENSALDDEPEEAVILALWLGRYILTDGFIAYRAANGVFFPLGEVVRALEFPIDVQPSAGRADGWFIDETRRFSLDLDRREVFVADQRQTVDPALVQMRIDDIYVESEVLSDWFPVDFEIDFNRLLVEVTSREPLPFELSLERETARKRYRPTLTTETLPRQPTPYRMIDWPFVDVGLTAGARKRGTFQPDGRFALRASGDLVGMSSGWSVYSDVQDTLVTLSIRGRVERRDPDANLLGPLGARTVAVGDVASPRIALVSRGESGAGFEASNHDLRQTTEFDRITLRGDVLPGWEVELYQGPTLLDFITVGEDGRYVFEDVPLVFGQNEFRLVFHGTQGQTREEIRRFEVGRELLRPGQHRYRLIVSEAGRQLVEVNETLRYQRRDVGMYASLELEQGVHRNLSLAAGWASVPVRGLHHDYANLGVRATMLGAYFRADGSLMDGGAGHAARVSAQTRRVGIGVLAEQTFLSRFNSDEFDIISDPLTSQSELRIDGTIPRSVIPPVALSMEGLLERHQSTRSQLDVSGRAGISWRHLSLANTWRWLSMRMPAGVGTFDRVEGAGAVSTRLGAVSLRGMVNYDVRPTYSIRTVDITGDWRMSKRLRGYAGAVREIAVARTSYLGGFSWDLEHFFLGLGGRYETADDYEVRLSLAFSVAREPRTGEWLMRSDRLADRGALSARVFLDDNQNGVLDPGEQPIEGVRLRRVGRGRGDATDANGVVFVPGLSSYDPVNVEIEPGSLDDPYWMPEREGIEIVPRPGRAAVVDFGLVTTGEIDGTVFLDSGGLLGGLLKEVSNVDMELVDSDGALVQNTRTAFDGFYLFSMVPPGEYTVRVAEEQMIRLDLIAPEPEKAVIEPSGNVVSGVSFTLVQTSGRTTGDTAPKSDARSSGAVGGDASRATPDTDSVKDWAEKPTEQEVVPPSPVRSKTRILDISDIEQYVGSYFIHMGSYYSAMNAQRAASDVEMMGVDAKVVFVDLGNRGLWYRVYAGPIASREAAEELLRSIEGDIRFPEPRLVDIEE